MCVVDSVERASLTAAETILRVSAERMKK